MRLLFRASVLLFIFFLISCKKDKKDNISPAIACTSPAVNQHYNMYDTIVVTAHVSDNEHLSYINITFTDLNHTPLQGTQSVPVQSADFNFSIRYPLTQFHIASGNYLIQILADDGYNTAALYQPISITESPTLLWGFCTVIKNATQTINFIDTTAATLSSIALSKAYNGMRYGAYNQQLYVNGNNTMPFQSFGVVPPIINQSPVFTASATISQSNYTSIYTDGNKPYVGFLNSDINSFDNIGNYNTSYRLNDGNFYPYLFTKSLNYAVGVYKSKVTGVPDKIVSFTSFGAYYQSTTLPTANFTVVALFEKNADTLFVLGNDANHQARAYLFNVPTNSFSTSYLSNILNGITMLSGIKVNSDNFIFSTNSAIYSYHYSTQNCPPTSPGAQKLVYQPKLNLLAAASGMTLNLYKVSTTTLTPISGSHSSLTCTDSIIDVEVITNK